MVLTGITRQEKDRLGTRWSVVVEKSKRLPCLFPPPDPLDHVRKTGVSRLAWLLASPDDVVFWGPFSGR